MRDLVDTDELRGKSGWNSRRAGCCMHTNIQVV